METATPVENHGALSPAKLANKWLSRVEKKKETVERWRGDPAGCKSGQGFSRSSKKAPLSIESAILVAKGLIGRASMVGLEGRNGGEQGVVERTERVGMK